MPEREKSIDILKGVAIVLMSFVHINSLFYDGRGILDSITYLGGTVCFSIFLFCVAYIEGKKLLNESTVSFKKIFRRFLSLYICYILLGLLSFFIFKISLDSVNIGKLMIFATLPLYVEFLASFIFFLLFFTLFRRFLKFLMKYSYLLLPVGVLFYVFGMLLYGIKSENIYIVWLQTNIVGYKDIHSFPLFQYMIVYMLGLFLSKHSSRKYILTTFLVSVFLFAVLLSFNISSWYRWPPSPLFLSEGISFLLLILLILSYIPRLKDIAILELFGKNPLKSLFLLTFLTLILKLFLSVSSNSLLILGLNLVVLLLAYIGILLSKNIQI